MDNIIKFSAVNTDAIFILNPSTYVINYGDLYSHVLLSEYATVDELPPNIGLIKLFTDYIVFNAKLVNTLGANYLYYKSKTLELSLRMYSANDYVKKIEHKLLEVAGRYDLLIAGNKKIAISYDKKTKDIEKKLSSDIAIMRLEFNKDMELSMALVDKLEAEIKHLNVRIAKQSLATEERVKKINDLTLRLEGECSICFIESSLVPVGCCANKCCVNCFIKSIVNCIFTCPYCRRKTC